VVNDRLVLRVTAVAAVFALVVCTAAGAAGGQWVTLTDKPEGFALTVPKSIFVVPNSPAKVKAIITRLKKENQAGVASVYSQILSSSDVTKFVYEGFFLEQSSPVQPLFTLGVDRTVAANTTRSGLAKVAAAEASSLRGGGATVTASKVVSLPAGPAAYVDANQTVSGAKTRLVEYVIGHGDLVYLLTFRTTGAGTDLSVFNTIAKRFAFA
jgi:hypothetical protein